MPDEHERRLFRAMLSMLRVTATGDLDLPAEVEAAVHRWDRLLEAELGAQARTRLVRLVGDGLFLNVLPGQPREPADVEAFILHLELPDGAT